MGYLVDCRSSEMQHIHINLGGVQSKTLKAEKTGHFSSPLVLKTDRADQKRGGGGSSQSIGTGPSWISIDRYFGYKLL